MNCVLWVLALRISLHRSKRAQVQHCTMDLCTKLWPENCNFVAKVGVPRFILDTGILTHYIASEQRIIVRTMTMHNAMTLFRTRLFRKLWNICFLSFWINPLENSRFFVAFPRTAGCCSNLPSASRKCSLLVTCIRYANKHNYARQFTLKKSWTHPFVWIYVSKEFVVVYPVYQLIHPSVGACYRIPATYGSSWSLRWEWLTIQCRNV